MVSLKVGMGGSQGTGVRGREFRSRQSLSYVILPCGRQIADGSLKSPPPIRRRNTSLGRANSVRTVIFASRSKAMGWWKIDARTGQPLSNGSRLSTPEVTLLNAVPGVDDSAEASYLGDVSGDFALEMARQLSGIVKGQAL